MATLAVVQSVADYGATHDEELVVPLTVRMVDPPSRSPPAWTRKKWMWAGLMGLTATAVASSAVLSFSILDFSNQESTAPSVLLQARGGADDNTCVPASGPWPTGAVSRQRSVHDDDHAVRSGPFLTCFSLRGGEDYCWSHSKYWSGDWYPCTPNGGFGPQGWAFDLTRNSLGSIETCCTGCTKFA